MRPNDRLRACGRLVGSLVNHQHGRRRTVKCYTRSHSGLLRGIGAHSYGTTRLSYSTLCVPAPCESRIPHLHALTDYTHLSLGFDPFLLSKCVRTFTKRRGMIKTAYLKKTMGSKKSRYIFVTSTHLKSTLAARNIKSTDRKVWQHARKAIKHPHLPAGGKPIRLLTIRTAIV